jgi:nitronate monooxygenase
MRIPWAVPVMQAPIGPATTPELVGTVSRVGALGTLAASWTEPVALRRQVRRLREAVDGRFCVNLVLAFDQRERLEIALAEGAHFVSFSWGVDPELIRRSHDKGAVVLVQVGDVAAANEAADSGADIVIAQGVEAGGHVQGTKPLVELLREVRAVLELPIVAAGGIADQESARAALAAGADAVACGTAFLAASEADVHPVYRDRLFRAAAADTVLTTVFDVGWPEAPHRVIRNHTYLDWVKAGEPARHRRPGMEDIIGTRDGNPILRYSDAQPTISTAGDIEAMALYAGTSVGRVSQLASAAEITHTIASALR